MNKKLLVKLIYLIYILSVLGIVSGCAPIKTKDLKGKIILNDQDNLLLLDYDVVPPKVEKTFIVKSLRTIFEPSISSDGSFVFFSYHEGLPYSPEKNLLVRMNIISKKLDTLILNYKQELSCCSLSPDNLKLAFLIAGPEKKTKGIFGLEGYGLPAAGCAIYNFKDSSYTIITAPMLSLCKPSWALDGSSLWVSTYEGKMIRIDLKGNIVESLGRGYNPTLSPNGKYLAYLDGHSIVKIDLASMKKKTIVSGLSCYVPQEYQLVSITWSPDSKYLLYQGQNWYSFITGFSSQYVVTSANGWGWPKILENITAYGFGAAWGD